MKRLTPGAVHDLLEACEDLLNVMEMSDSGKPLVSNQGQPLDGYSELTNYRFIIINKVKKAVSKAKGE